MELKAFISGLISLAPGVSAINALVKQARGQRRELLRELQNNINQISVYIESGAPPELTDKVIAKLQTQQYEAAGKAGFVFNSLKRGRLKRELVGDLPQFRSYAGLSTEELFEKLYSWIHRLQIIAADYGDDKKLRKNVRLINIWKLMLLIARHIKAK